MDNVKPWQIVLVVIGIGVLGFSLWRFSTSNSIPKTNGYMTVDIMTGQLYDLRKGKAKGVPMPAKNPDTGDRTLYPAKKIDDITWEIPPGFESFLSEKVRKGSLLQPGEYEIEVLPNKPIKVIVKK